MHFQIACYYGILSWKQYLLHIVFYIWVLEEMMRGRVKEREGGREGIEAVQRTFDCVR